MRQFVVACLALSPKKPLDEKALRARVDRQVDKLIDKHGVDVFWRGIDRKTQPELPLMQQAAE